MCVLFCFREPTAITLAVIVANRMKRQSERRIWDTHLGQKKPVGWHFKQGCTSTSAQMSLKALDHLNTSTPWSAPWAQYLIEVLPLVKWTSVLEQPRPVNISKRITLHCNEAGSTILSLFRLVTKRWEWLLSTFAFGPPPNWNCCYIFLFKRWILVVSK